MKSKKKRHNIANAIGPLYLGVCAVPCRPGCSAALSSPPPGRKQAATADVVCHSSASKHDWLQRWHAEINTNRRRSAAFSRQSLSTETFYCILDWAAGPSTIDVVNHEAHTSLSCNPLATFQQQRFSCGRTTTTTTALWSKSHPQLLFLRCHFPSGTAQQRHRRIGRTPRRYSPATA